jgi:glycosyl transferase family 25
MKIDTYVISLPRATERRLHVTQTYNRFVENLRLIDAVDARDFTPPQILAMIEPERRGWSNYLRAGAVCCALSHIKAYREFLSSGADRCLILEDDAELVVRKTLFEEVLHRAAQTDFDVICLNSFSLSETTLKHTADIYGGIGLYVGADEQLPGSGLSYLLSRRAAEQIIRYQNPIKDAADAWSSFSNATGVRVAFLKPDLFEPFNFESTIDYTGKTLAKRLAPKLLRDLRRWLIHRKMKKNVLFK